MKNEKDVIIAMTKEEYKDNVKKIEDILFDSIKNLKHSQINIVYNHYYNISRIELVRKKLLPIENQENSLKNKYKEDFVIEGDINKILINIMVLYLSYEIRVAQENSYASENIMRQMITRESLKKIKEIREEKVRIERKVRKNKNFKKVIENFIKLRNKDG